MSFLLRLRKGMSMLWEITRGIRRSSAKKEGDKKGNTTKFLKPTTLLKAPEFIDKHYRDLVELRNQQMRQYFPQKEEFVKPTIKEQVDIQLVIRAYQYRGHMVSRIDPLELVRKKPVRPEFPSPIVLRQHRIPVKRQKLYMLPKNTSIGDGQNNLLLDTMIEKLETVYCGSIGLEYMYVPSRKVKFWLREKFERTRNTHISQEEEISILRKLVEVEEFERFFLEKCPQEVKYSIAGCEMIIPALMKYIMAAENITTFIIGMPRVGRLAILTQLMNKPQTEVFNTFTHGNRMGLDKFDLGSEAVFPSLNKAGVEVKICLLGISGSTAGYVPVTFGAVKSLMQKKSNHTVQRPSNICPIIIHDPQSLQSEAVNFETMALCHDEEFKVHGALHIVMNNEFQEHMLSRQSIEYCTDVGKCINAPIIHVNAQDLRAVMHVMEVAAEYRNQFGKDIYVDLVGYRKVQKYPKDLIKHSEVEKQKIIDIIPSIAQKLARELIQRKVVTQEEVDLWKSQYKNTLYTNFVLSEERYSAFVESFWKECISQHSFERAERRKGAPTDISNRKLRRVVSLDPLYFKKLAEALCEEPGPGFTVPIPLAHMFQQREFKVKNNLLDWYTAEALAFLTLIKDGLRVRLSGKEVNKRNYIVSEDKIDGRKLNLFNKKFNTDGLTVAESESTIEVTLGYEFGFSINNHEYMVIWEADEGDSISRAQHYIDNYLVSPPYGRESSIVVLCPHGYVKDPFSISNGRPERFLQLLNLPEDDVISPSQEEQTNLIITSVTTPTNYFHLLRKQAHLPAKRPLIVFSPTLMQTKSHDWESSYDDLIEVFNFQAYKKDESIESHSTVRKHILCTGQIYYDLVKLRNSLGLSQKIAVTRLEQICPFPFEQVLDDIYMHPEVSLCWVQSEPQNQGWWTYLEPRLNFILQVFHVSMGLTIEFITRPASSVPDSSSEFEFNDEIDHVIHAAMKLPKQQSK